MRYKLLLATLTSGVLLTGCATDPNTGQMKPNKAMIGGLLGAAAGAGVSKATGGEKTGRDAAIGAVLGAGVGYYMQQQEEKLRQQTAGTGIQITRDPNTNNIDMVMPEAITFAFDSSTINPSFLPTLNKVASTLAQFDKTTVTVKGHTDSIGTPAYNQGLSERRAYAVANYLINQGVMGSRIHAVGYGMNYPVAPNTTEAGRAQNRRVEITINAPKS